MIKKIIILFSAVIIMISISCKNDRESPEFKESYLEEVAENNDMYETLRSQSELKDFAEALNDVVETPIQSETFTYTVFAPTNEAFSVNQTNIMEDPDLFAELLEYHIIGETILLDDLRNKLRNEEAPLQLVALNGKELQVSLEGDKIALKDELGNTAYILRSIEAMNGVVHIIDNTLVPEQSLEN